MRDASGGKACGPSICSSSLAWRSMAPILCECRTLSRHVALDVGEDGLEFGLIADRGEVGVEVAIVAPPATPAGPFDLLVTWQAPFFPRREGHRSRRPKVRSPGTGLSGIRTQRCPFTLRFPLYARPPVGGGGSFNRAARGHTFRHVRDGFGGPIGYRLMLNIPIASRAPTHRVSDGTVIDSALTSAPSDSPLA